ncbi:acetyltransferase [Microbacterium capsulatum]|uniref:Acetyltransferase n=1 Tax=Microbacterium capsulatum TaxID=3041921 RepID=A0ABU0XH71_9MICO|nr:acetyltransferase [Microbacterium sp. ASV81]MDQ4214237.1 acetyltransferase [Microbacterium sp. ASV81]
MTRAFVVGAGGFGREVLDVLRDQGIDIEGVVDDAPSEQNLRLLERQGVRYLGTVEHALREYAGSSVRYLLGIGSAAVRRVLDERFSEAGIVPMSVVHSSATMGFDVRIAPGAVVCAGVRITSNVELGRHVHLNLNVTVGHDTTIEDYVSVNPGAAISGAVTIREEALLGANAFILQGLEVGRRSVVGASAAAMRSVQPDTTVVGVPARILARRPS